MTKVKKGGLKSKRRERDQVDGACLSMKGNVQEEKYRNCLAREESEMNDGNLQNRRD